MSANVVPESPGTAKEVDTQEAVIHRLNMNNIVTNHNEEGIPFNVLDPEVVSHGLPLMTDRVKIKSNADTKLVFIGTGTSGALPHAWCVLKDEDGDGDAEYGCSTCSPSNKKWSRNYFKNDRANTSVVVVKQSPVDKKMKTFVVDVGMEWKKNALSLFKSHGLKKIDALLLSHCHSDAMNLDWLRDWTEDVREDKFYYFNHSIAASNRKQYKFRIQDHIDVYATTNTRERVRNCKPYVVSKSAGSGGGHVGAYHWTDNITDKRGDLAFEVDGIKVLGVDVHHGYESRESDDPLLCTSFRIDDDILYMGDVSDIPEDKLDRFIHTLNKEVKRPKILVVDCLETTAYERQSHFHLEASLKWAKRIDAERTYLTGFSHNTCHEAYMQILHDEREITHFDSKDHKAALEHVKDNIITGGLLRRDDGSPLDVRVAYDGLCVNIHTDRNGKQYVRDDMDRERKKKKKIPRH